MKKVATLIVAGVLSSMNAQALSIARLTVRVYDRLDTPAAELQAARGAFTAAFEDSGLEVAWLDCPRRSTGVVVQLCEEPPAEHDLIVRLVAFKPALVPATRHNELGYVRLDRHGTRMPITVFGDRVHSTAARARAEAGVLLGHVIAHEVGHVLLGDRHAKAGLMRPRWTLDEMRGGESAKWRFIPDIPVPATIASLR